MGAKWTAEQQRAISLRGQNMLVAAGAGSGKTAVLTERIVSLVREDESIANMLVVTFTNAAAAEMKRRIQQRLAELCTDQTVEPGTRTHLREQLSGMGKANISTLHAFCVTVLRRHFQQAEVDPAFRVGDEIETSVLRSLALDEVIDEAYDRHDGGGDEADGFFALCDFAGKREIALRELILKVYGFLFAQTEPWEWLDDAVARYGLDEQGVEASEAMRLLYKDATRDLTKAASLIARARGLLPGDEAFDKARALLDGEAMALRGFSARMKDGYAAVEQLCGFSFEALRFPKTDYDTEPVKALRSQAKELVCGIRDNRAHYSPAAQAQLLRLMRPQVAALAALVREFGERYAQKKAEKGVIDFADIEHGALTALRHPDIAAEYRERFAHVFIDEYQDSNVVQEAIIDRIRRENNLFCVGDVKQSIYRFRLAEPSLFSARQQAYADGNGGALVTLNANFRSAHNVLSCVNDLFSRIMNRESGEIDYDEDAALKPGREKEQLAASLVIDVIEKKAQDDEELEALLDAEWEARQAARRIRGRMQRPVWDLRNSAWRPAKYGDFAVLLRATKDVAHAFARIFALEGIPAFAELTGGYFEAVEVQVLVNLLRLCDNRRQDIPLLSVLRSGIGGFSDTQIEAIREKTPQGSYFDAFASAAAEDGELGKKASEFLGFLAEQRRQSRIVRLDRFVEDLIEKTGYADAVAMQEGGAQRTANVEALIDRARSYESSQGRGLYGFLAYLDRLAESDELGEARRTGEDADCVRIMSVHKSKGLEFPIVIHAMTGRKFNLRDAQGDFALHRTLGIGCTAFDPETRTKADALYRHAIAAQTRRESIAEEMRVLYVAMTRAKEELILIGSANDIEKRAGRWQGGDACCPLDWALSAALRFATRGDLKEAFGLASGSELCDGDWEVNLVRRSQLQPQSGAMRRMEALERFAAGAADADASYFAERYAWRYPFTSSQAPSKLAASKLSAPARAELNETPRFLSDRPMTAADVGTALHAALFHLDLRGPLDEDGIRGQLSGIVGRELMTEEQAAAVDASMLAGFFASGLGRRMAAAKELHREQPFTIFKSAREILSIDSDDRIVIQGVIDAFFEENGEWVLLDYKSDGVGDRSEQTLYETAQRHRGQLALYAEALERQTGRRVAELQVFLLRAGVSVLLQR